MFTGLIIYLTIQGHREPVHGTVILTPRGGAVIVYPLDPVNYVAKWGYGDNWPLGPVGLLPLHGSAQPVLRTDFNGDGIHNSQDLFDFLTQFYIDAATQGAMQ